MMVNPQIGLERGLTADNWFRRFTDSIAAVAD